MVPNVIFDIQHTSDSVCVTCNFVDNLATACIVIVHQRTSRLDFDGLMNIESSHKLNRTGGTAYGCIEGVNLEHYQIGVVGGRQENQG